MSRMNNCTDGDNVYLVGMHRRRFLSDIGELVGLGHTKRLVILEIYEKILSYVIFHEMNAVFVQSIFT